MTSQSWRPAPLPEAVWTTGHVPDHSNFVQPSGSDWQSHGAPVTTQDMQTLDAAAWLQASHGIVDLGLSPVLSHKSQSSHTLNSLSEPDMSMLPPRADLSFSAEPSWTYTSPVLYANSRTMSQPVSGTCYASAPLPVTYDQHMETLPGSGYAAPQSTFPRIHQPVFYHPGGQSTHPESAMLYSPVVHRRPLLPRTEGPAVPSQPAFGPQRILRPQVPVSQGSQSTVSTVSSMPGSAHGSSQRAQMPTYGSSAVSSAIVQRLPSGVMEPGHAIVSSRPEIAVQTKPVGPVGYLADHTEDWNSFIQFDPEDQCLSPASLRSEQDAQCADHCGTDVSCSFPAGYGTLPAVSSLISTSDSKPLRARPEQVPSPSFEDPSTGAAVMPGDNDEGRHRTHPLYNEGPQADGLYHCPFKSDPSCQHKPTKLKCNYDKFIDSHIKPFRCKMEACAKQEFSSTACLLRHEREAHGMHGHGDRPHLCYYPGCERGIPGNGFPRRYNLFDHMKRVHDHKEEPTSLTGSPDITGESHGQKKAGGRKRKASGSSPPEQPAHQRQRSLHGPSESRTMAMPQMDYQQGTVASQHVETSQQQLRKNQHKQRLLYSQWANQRDLLARQMDFLQSPDDEANLQRLSQNVNELRRLSQEARRG